MEDYKFGCKNGHCDCSRFEKKEFSFGNTVKYTFYAIALGITLYAAYQQFFDNPDTEKNKVEQVGKTIDDSVKQ